ncbi:GIY-YIG nuclease family protein [Bacillaceae bacterium C204]|uniref:GIY-YIG nuclease family protein n=1 Tax=Neobacillus sp. 204 TaxID=3383351 RepID=UPI00397882EF
MDFDKKKHLLEEWISLYRDKFRIEFAAEGQKINKQKIQELINRHCSNYRVSIESIYLLCMFSDNETIPVYIGKSVNPYTRWKSHIGKLLEGKGSYLRWKYLLIHDDDIAKHTLILLIIPDHEIVTPPIPNFPKTVGSVEYQLVSLVSDAYPDTLLNKEGNRR